MEYTLLEDAYPDGGDFKSRTTVKEGKTEDPAAARRRTNPSATKSVADLVGVLPLDKDVETSNFKPTPMKPSSVHVQESFTTQGGDDMKVKLEKILMMVEQNKTGYEPNSTNDMFLYILTGVMFLFTFDTFVMLGKSMRV